jgi:hypothetical protein
MITGTCDIDLVGPHALEHLQPAHVVEAEVETMQSNCFWPSDRALPLPSRPR